MSFNKNITCMLITVLVLLCGCTSPSKKYFYKPANLGASHVQYMAHDVAPVIAENNPDKDTLFLLSGDAFGTALSYELGKRGYSTMLYRGNTHDVPEKALLITYQIDWLDIDQTYLALNVGNKQRITKQYNIEEEGTYPSQQLLIGLKK